MITEAQRRARLDGIGASDAAAVLGVHPHMTPYELWCIKTRRCEQKQILTPEKLRIRNAHEATIANEYAFRHEVKLQRVNETIYHPEHKFLFCHLDRKVVGQKKFVECKSSISWMAKAFGESGTTDVPTEYLIQMLFTFIVTKYTAGDLAALIDIDTFKEFPIPPNQKLMAHIEAQCIHFWNEYVLKDIPPPLETRHDVELMFPVATTVYKQAEPAAVELFTAIDAAYREGTALSDKQEKLKDDFCKFIREAEGLTHGDTVLCTWRPNAKGTRVLRINYGALKPEFAEVAA